MWPHDTFPTECGGHTYLGFITKKEKTFLSKGVVEPIPSGNFHLLTKEYQKSFHEAFLKLGYRLEVPK